MSYVYDLKNLENTDLKYLDDISRFIYDNEEGISKDGIDTLIKLLKGLYNEIDDLVVKTYNEAYKEGYNDGREEGF